MTFRQQERIEALAERAPHRVSLECLGTVVDRKHSFPIYAVSIGTKDRSRPTFGLFGGVHGLERVGTEIVLSYLETLVARLQWDKETRRLFKKCRLVSIPMVNPWGIYFMRRSNANGVDLMRNAPVEADSHTPLLAGGHRLTNRLPWYRGSGEWELESKTLIDFVRREVFASRAALTLDVHSGFGMRDRLWYPYARSKEPFADIEAVRAFSELLEISLPHNVYRVEQQSDQYCTHGDLWDYLHDEHAQLEQRNELFVPWTLEIGSWSWVRKNPRQIFRADGLFDPVKPHRHNRTMRRHIALLDFFLRAVRNYRRWLPDAATGFDTPSDADEVLGERGDETLGD